MTTASGNGATELRETNIILRMLYFCEEPKGTSQIMSYCGIDRSHAKKYSQHCIGRGTLKMSHADYGLEVMVTTERGKEVLATAENIVRELGINSEQGLLWTDVDS